MIVAKGVTLTSYRSSGGNGLEQSWRRVTCRYLSQNLSRCTTTQDGRPRGAQHGSRPCNSNRAAHRSIAGSCQPFFACANAIWYFDASKRSMILRTTTDIAKGGLCYNYGGSCTSGRIRHQKYDSQWKMSYTTVLRITSWILLTKHSCLTYSLLRRLANTTAAAAPKAVSEAREKVEGNDDDDLEHLRYGSAKSSPREAAIT